MALGISDHKQRSLHRTWRVPFYTAAQVVQAVTQTVTVLSGPSPAVLTPAVLTAAAATSPVVLRHSINELQAGEHRLVMWLQGAGAVTAEAAAAAAAGTVGDGSPHPSAHQQEDEGEQCQWQLPPALLLIDVASEELLGAHQYAILQRWCSHCPWAAAAVSDSSGNLSPIRPLHVVLLCKLSQSRQLQGVLGCRCYQLAIPGTPHREQLESDIRAQLLAQRSSALSAHIQDLNEALQTGIQSGSLSPARLADGLASVLADVHLTAAAAYAANFSTHAGSHGRTSSGAVTALRQRSTPPHAPAASVLGGSSTARPLVAAADDDLRIYEAVPLSKPSEALHLAQHLWVECRQRQTARRAALRSALTGAQRYLELLDASAAGAQAADAAGGLSEGSSAAALAASAQVVGPDVQLQELRDNLMKLVAKWADELCKVTFLAC